MSGDKCEDINHCRPTTHGLLNTTCTGHPFKRNCKGSYKTTQVQNFSPADYEILSLIGLPSRE